MASAKKSSASKIVTYGLITILILLIVGGFAWWQSKDDGAFDLGSLTGGEEKPYHPYTNEQLAEEERINTEAANALRVLAEGDIANIDEHTVSIIYTDGKYTFGVARIVGDTEFSIPPGPSDEDWYIFAANTPDGLEKIVVQQKGTVSCDLASAYEIFPSSFVDEPCDQVTESAQVDTTVPDLEGY